MEDGESWKARRRWAALVTVALAAGCARDRGPVRENGFSHSSTLGSDLRAVPPGVTVPPPALGVDLVRGVARAADRDPGAIRAGGGGVAGPSR